MLTPPTSPVSPPTSATSAALYAFATGDLVEVFTDSVRALARVRESDGGRLHIAFEMGEYLPWVDTAVLIRHAAHADVVAPRACSARILHAGTSTAMLQILGAVEEPPAGREPYDTLPLLED
ncbi:MAG: hypothetical protein JWO86_7311 [Myxococcaceae bacterium]|nr:hypothetical protein [Myxococcaceae bacterium]MEA2747114.1 hypothetical protein [Myxococcales bacterium]